jgi:hypothetical protein
MNTIKTIFGNFLLLFVEKKHYHRENVVPKIFKTEPLLWTPHGEKK